MSGNGFFDLLGVLRVKREVEQELFHRPPVACPNDGTTLIIWEGTLRCPFDGYTYHGETGVY